MRPFSMITSSAISQSRVYFPAGFKKENLKKKNRSRDVSISKGQTVGFLVLLELSCIQ